MRALERAYDAALANAQAGIEETMATFSKTKSASFLTKAESKGFSITLQPPAESDVVGSLDAILSSEVAKSEAVAADFASLKATMLEKAKAVAIFVFLFSFCVSFACRVEANIVCSMFLVCLLARRLQALLAGRRNLWRSCPKLATSLQSE